MMSSDGHSKSCCEIPAVIGKDYETKGTYEIIGGVKTYVTGPSTSTIAILFIYDIFGYRPQTLQGADIIAATGNYQVFMPDFFEGNPCDLSWHPAKTDEQKEKLRAWFPTRMPSKGVERIPSILKNLESYNPRIRKWGVVGTCWGGKVISLTSAAGTPWTVAAQLHPAFVDASDASKVTIPMCLLASKDESAEDVKKFGEALTVPKHVETFEDQIHGWMAARADFEDPKAKKEYVRGYETVLNFFAEHFQSTASL